MHKILLWNDKECLKKWQGVSETFAYSLLIIHIVHKKKEISSEILYTCVASQLFTNHHGLDIYFPYLILLDSQFVTLNKMCMETLNIAV